MNTERRTSKAESAKIGMERQQDTRRKAEAYDKLVAALQALVRDADQQCKDEGWPVLDSSEEAKGLLKELGE